MKKIKSSFIGKAFFSLIVLYLVVFLFLFVFQGIVFRTYYTREVIKDIKNETSTFVQKETYNIKQIEELTFSRNTNTITSLIPFDDIEENFSSLNLTILDVSYDNKEIKVYAPIDDNVKYTIGDDISLMSSMKLMDIYIPSYLVLNNETLFRSNNSADSNANHLDLPVSGNQYIQLDGVISNISYNDTTEINSFMSNEILNITAGNYISLVPFNQGGYYFSNMTYSNTSNLVFYTVVDFDNEDHILLSVYPMEYIDEIVLAAGRANVYMFIVVLFILIISSFVYSREFSRPLLFINKKTKELSLLDFSSPFISLDSTDEFAELAKNINTLSANLQTTLYQLNEQNKQLSDAIAKENVLENNRREFIQGMSHELKTPLAVIQASAEAITNNIYDTEEEKHQALVLIQEEVLKTKNMLNSMIEVYKLDSPDYQNKWIDEDLSELIRGIDKSLSPLYISSNINVKLHLDNATLKCDKEKIEIVITNLLTNAIKYTPNGESIFITLEDTPSEIRFKIQNFGVSIDIENQDKLFDAFYRVDKARNRNDGSTGLGLYIVNQTLEQYNSKCIVESDKNSVTFKFSIKKSI